MGKVNFKRVFINIGMTALVVGAFAGCGGSSGDYAKYAEPAAEAATGYSYDDYDYATDDIYNGYAEESAVEAEEPQMKDSGSGIESTGNDEIAAKNRKIIKTVNITAETEDFDNLIENVTRKVEALGGYMSNTDISGRSLNDGSSSRRHANLTARVPAKNLDALLNNVEESSNITYKTESAEDVTLNYADTKARIDSLRTEQTRLNELIVTADDIDTLIILEQRLTEVRYEIESYESRLRTMDDQIDYSTVYLSINEVEKYTPDPIVKRTVGERISEGFKDSFKDVCEGMVDLFVGIIVGLPYIIAFLIIIGIIALIIFAIVKLIIYLSKKSAAKHPKKVSAADKAVKADYENLKPVVLPKKKSEDSEAK